MSASHSTHFRGIGLTVESGDGKCNIGAILGGGGKGVQLVSRGSIQPLATVPHQAGCTLSWANLSSVSNPVNMPGVCHGGRRRRGRGKDPLQGGAASNGIRPNTLRGSFYDSHREM